MKIDVDIYQKIRKLHQRDGLSQRQIARDLGISRNTVKKYATGAQVPWERKSYTSRGGIVITEEVVSFIKKCFAEDDEHDHSKQKHTAKRIYTRLVEENNFQGSYSSVKVKVRELRKKSKEVFIPLSFNPGEAAQIDFGSAYIFLNQKQIKIKYFCMRLCFSAQIYVKAYLAEKEECFLDGLVSAFKYFKGVPNIILFDNAKVAVKEGYGAHVTKLSSGYDALKAHYSFDTKFCNPRSGNEKGLVENLVGLIRRNTMVPMPRVETLDELNLKLEKSCDTYLSHKINGEQLSVGDKFLIESKALLPLPAYHYDLSKKIYSIVSNFSTVNFETNKYSVPCEFVGKEILLKIDHSNIYVSFKGKTITKHQRSFKKNQKFYKIKHYVKALERKPRSILNARPVKNFVPKEILETYQKLPDGNLKVLNYIKQSINLDNNFSVEVQSPNLKQYDALIQGEVN